VAFKMRGGAKSAESDINVTPLIDVVLVLLIIFMVLTPRVIEEMSANLPSKTEVKPNKDPDKDQPLVVAVYDNGDIALNLKVMPKAELAQELKGRIAARDQRVVFVDAHPNLEYGLVVDVMDLVRDAGAERVGLARLKDEGPARPAAPADGAAPAEGAAPAAPATP
jgi:biopolymer transport protein TolR